MNFQMIFLNLFFAELNKNNITYCVLRNYERLPQYISSHDIDILLDINDLKKAVSCIETVATKVGVKTAFFINHQYVKVFIFFKIYRKQISSIKIDYFFNFETGGAVFMNSAEILHQTKIYKNFYVIDSVQEAIINWLNPLITGHIVKDKYRKKIYNIITSYPDNFKSYMASILGTKLTDKLWPLLANGNLVRTLEYFPEIRRQSWLMSFRRNPFAVTKGLLSHLYVEIKRRLFPKKQMIVLIGPDGTGKSTVVDHLKEGVCNLMKWDIAKIKIFHFRPNILPNLKKLLPFGGKGTAAEEFTNPHRTKPSNAIFSLIRLLYYIGDYIFGYYYRLHWLFGKHYILLFDRYYYDFIVDPARSRIKLPKFIPMFLLKIVPKPTLTVLIDNDVDTILERKQELPASEIARQIKEYRSLLKLLPNAIAVDGRKSVADIVEEIAAEYIKKITIPVGRLTECCK